MLFRSNPWQWSGQHQIAEAFFQEMEVSLGRSGGRDAKRRAAKWRAYAAYLAFGFTVVREFRALTSILFGALALVAFLLGVLQAPAIRFISIALGIIFAVPAILLAGSSRVAASLATAFQAHAEANRQELAEKKAEVRRLLEGLDAPIVVVIDDIDRLTSEEACLLFQLVKANADFPNLVYLLLFDRNALALALGRIVHDGQMFLEKVVHVTMTVPEIEHPRLEAVLFAGIEKSLSLRSPNSRFDHHRWNNLYLAGLQSYFSNLRDVIRFLNGLSIQATLHRMDTMPEVDAVDLIAVEVMRLFDPGVLARVHTEKAAVTSPGRTASTAPALQAVDIIIQQAPPHRQDAVREILKYLFPAIAHQPGGHAYAADTAETWRGQLRICDPGTFDRYFLLRIPEGDVSQEDIAFLLGHVADRAKLVAKFRTLRPSFAA